MGFGVPAHSIISHRKVLPASTIIVPCKPIFNFPTFAHHELTVPTSGPLHFAHNLSVHFFVSFLTSNKSNSLDGHPASNLASRVAANFPFSSTIHLVVSSIFQCQEFSVKE
jgi:hypothetical protein